MKTEIGLRRSGLIGTPFRYLHYAPGSLQFNYLRQSVHYEL